VEEDRLTRLVDVFREALGCVSRRGYADEVRWARETRLKELTETTFLSQLAWCILNTGMRESVVRAKWDAISDAFFSFSSSEAICSMSAACVHLARRAFNNPPKLEAIAGGARRIRDAGGFRRFRSRLEADPMAELAQFAFIGPVTVFHLARNIGIDCAKPDRHLVRLAAKTGYTDVTSMCSEIATAADERIGVVDVVLWRHLAIGCPCASTA
jgi:hypothetical protein